MNQIKLFVCCHKEEQVPAQPLLVPIQVGAALSDKHFENFLHDDKGENISAKNRSYCELTALFWMWKNVQADYYGLFHYRRYLYPDTKAHLPYRICAAATDKQLDALGFGRFESLIPEYDIIMPLAEDMHVSVREHYANAPHHHGRDLKLAESIVLEQHPEMEQALEAYFSGTRCYFGNICIMSKAVFNDYCAWLFPILEEFDRRVDTSSYGVQEKRVDGYLAERLLGLYYTHHHTQLETHELPRVHFVNDREERLKLQLQNILLPPGSKIRALAKKVRK